MQVDQRRVFVCAVDGLIQPHAIHREGGAGAKPLGGLNQVFFTDAANIGHHFGRVFAHGFFERLKAFGVVADVGHVEQPLPQHDVQQAIEQGDIRARQNRQVQVGKLGGVGAAWIHHHNFHVGIVGFGILNASENDGVRVRCIGARNKQATGLVDVFIAGRRGIRAQGRFVTGHRGAHAQARVGVDVIGADQPFGQLVKHIVVFGEQLARNIKCHGIRAMGLDNLGKSVHHMVECRVPTDALFGGVTRQAGLRVQAPRIQLGSQVQGRALGAQAAIVGRMFRVAFDVHNLLTFSGDDDPTAHAAITAGTACFAPLRIKGDRCGSQCVGGGLKLLLLRHNVPVGLNALFVELQINVAVFYFDRVTSGVSHIRLFGLAVHQADFPAMQGAGHFVTIDDALRQRAAFVRAAVIEREHAVVFGAEHADVDVTMAYNTGTQHRDVVHRADFCPTHFFLFFNK